MTNTNILAAWLASVVLASAAAILTRYCEIPASSIGFWRVFGAGVVFLPFALKVMKDSPGQRLFTVGTLLPRVFLGLHFTSWCWAIQNTSLANAALFIALQPLITPFIAVTLLRERTNKWENWGIVVALAGTIWLGAFQATISIADLPGSMVALLSAFMCATYLVLCRKYRAGHNVMVFVSGVFLVAALVQGVLGFALAGGIELGDTRSMLALVGLILFPTVGGHGIVMFLLKYAKSQLLAFSIPAQFIIVAIVAVPLFGEIPPLWFYPGAAAVLLGVVLGIARFGKG
ncbi:MAG: DMT family transporter [Victivallales bacterium]|nr:DMT family transporter [Victivallales bacterium]